MGSRGAVLVLRNVQGCRDGALTFEDDRTGGVVFWTCVHQSEWKLQGQFSSHDGNQEFDLDVVGDVDGEHVAVVWIVGVACYCGG